jgi:hypothetical protein
MQYIICKISFGRFFICLANLFAAYMHFYTGKILFLENAGVKNGGVVDISAMDTYSEMDLCTLILLGEARKKNWMANHF